MKLSPPQRRALELFAASTSVPADDLDARLLGAMTRKGIVEIDGGMARLTAVGISGLGAMRRRRKGGDATRKPAPIKAAPAAKSNGNGHAEHEAQNGNGHGKAKAAPEGPPPSTLCAKILLEAVALGAERAVARALAGHP